MADPNGYAYEHLVVWMSNGGSRPAEGCVLHHINGDKQDNRIENLRVEARGDHNKHHNAERGRNKDGTFRARTGKKAAGCLLDGREHKEWPQ